MSIFLFWKIKPDHWLSSNLHCYQSIWLVIWSSCSVLGCKNGVSVLLFILINIAKALAQKIKHVLEPTSVFSKAMYVNNIFFQRKATFSFVAKFQTLRRKHYWGFLRCLVNWDKLKRPQWVEAFSERNKHKLVGDIKTQNIW